MCLAGSLTVQNNFKASPLSLWFALIAISLMWGSTFLFVKLLVFDVPPFALTAIRAGVATLAFIVGMVAFRIPFRFSRLQLQHAIVLSIFNSLIPDVLTAFSVLKVDSEQAGIINATNPLITALLAHFLIADERLNWRKAIGIIVGFCGVFILIHPAQLLDYSPLGAQLLMLGATTSYAVGTIYGRWVRAFSAVQLSLGQFLFTFFPASLISLAIEPEWHLSFELQSTVLIVILGVFCAAIPNVLFLYLLKNFSATNVSTITYLMPIWAIILGVSILHESLALHTAIGCAVILLGVWIVNQVPNAEAN